MPDTALQLIGGAIMFLAFGWMVGAPKEFAQAAIVAAGMAAGFALLCLISANPFVPLVIIVLAGLIAYLTVQTVLGLKKSSMMRREQKSSERAENERLNTMRERYGIRQIKGK